MADTVQRIDTQAFSDALDALGRALGAFSTARGKVESAAKALYASWDGDGCKAFKGVCSSLVTELTDEEENLATIRDSLQTILTSYQTWDQNAAEATKTNMGG